MKRRLFPFSLIYALGCVFLLVCRALQRRTPVLLTGLGFLVLAAIQGWIDIRDLRKGQVKDFHRLLLLGPCCVLFAVFWLHRGSTRDDGASIFLGFGFLAVAAIHLFRAICDIRDDREAVASKPKVQT